ncbi:MAG TPA: SDR family oxidoreductase [Candidatus Paceibacterota bacterium]|jgi:NAD(P)-dependent dehydrogenase (short-subunit alcohol dehydrogenase family)|nr:SDR family oxidoreductase [Candidatus Paceibacterota bacterium]
MQKKNNKKKTNIREVAERKQKRPAQHQRNKSGKTKLMVPEPEDHMSRYVGSGKLLDKVAVITGGDSGIGRATAIGMAKEGADIAIIYLKETKDATLTKLYIESAGRKTLLLKGDIGDENFCIAAIHKIIKTFGRIDILVNNAAEQHPQESIEDISEKQLMRTFRTNIFSMFFITKAAMRYLKKDASIINTASVTAYHGSPKLLDYSATKGAIVAFTRSLSASLAPRKIRVNAVAPGPVWTPLIPSTFKPSKVKKFGSDVPMKRAGQPDEIAPAFIFLASSESSYITGQTIHPNGGEIING